MIGQNGHSSYMPGAQIALYTNVTCLLTFAKSDLSVHHEAVSEMLKADCVSVGSSDCFAHLKD